MHTSASWLDRVERFRRDITDERLRCGVFYSVGDVEQAIMDDLGPRTANPKPYHLTATPDDILAQANKS